MATRIINLTELNDVAFPLTFKQRQISVMSGELSKKITELNKSGKDSDKRKAEELKKAQTFKIRIHFDRLTMQEATELIAETSQSPIVGLQNNEIRPLGDEKIKQIANGEFKKERKPDDMDQVWWVNQSGIVEMNLHKWLHRPSKRVAMSDSEKTIRSYEKLDENDKDEALRQMLKARGKSDAKIKAIIKAG